MFSPLFKRRASGVHLTVRKESIGYSPHCSKWKDGVCILLLKMRALHCSKSKHGVFISLFKMRGCSINTIVRQTRSSWSRPLPLCEHKVCREIRSEHTKRKRKLHMLLMLLKSMRPNTKPTQGIRMKLSSWSELFQTCKNFRVWRTARFVKTSSDRLRGCLAFFRWHVEGRAISSLNNQFNSSPKWPRILQPRQRGHCSLSNPSFSFKN